MTSSSNQKCIADFLLIFEIDESLVERDQTNKAYAQSI